MVQLCPFQGKISYFVKHLPHFYWQSKVQSILFNRLPRRRTEILHISLQHTKRLSRVQKYLINNTQESNTVNSLGCRPVGGPLLIIYPKMGQVKDFDIGVCCFSTKKVAFKRKRWFDRIVRFFLSVSSYGLLPCKLPC